MVFTKEVTLPSEEELTVQEVEVSTPGLRAASFHMGKACENVNNEFMLCRQECQDPRRCLNEGKAVTACSLDFFRKIKKNCAVEFTQFANCLDRSSADFSFKPCRKTQAVFDKCMLDNLKIERPYFGYFSEVKVHHTERPRPEVKKQEYLDMPRPVPDDLPLQPAKFGKRSLS
uniref:NADH dehydrogenase [ubiquinone] 1 alpha subcomplex subunit 8 n=1 Tax=Daphnia galeata TaxID=27404 RepID=A0A8J2RVG4_9CRUS|nr:unnamed protein product [Daphnia galeata]